VLMSPVRVVKDAPAAEGSTTDTADGNSTPSVNTAVNPASSNPWAMTDACSRRVNERAVVLPIDTLL